MHGKLARLILAAAMGVAVSAYAADACKDEMGHQGEKKKVQGKEAEYLKGSISDTGYNYEVWYGGGTGSMTYWDNGTFTAEWNGPYDYIARVGLAYSEAKTFDKFGIFSADFKFTKSGTADYSNIGVFGRMELPAVEFYIVDDWFTPPTEDYLGEKVGEFFVDGDTYDVWKIRRNTQPTIKGDVSYWQVVSLRRTPRQCGHIDITAHFKKWEELGIKLGEFNEVMMIVEVGGNAKGSIDFTYFRMNETVSSNPEPPTAIPVAKRSFKSDDAQIFDMQGRYLGTVALAPGASLDEIVFDKLKQSGKFLLKQGGAVNVVTVKSEFK